MAVKRVIIITPNNPINSRISPDKKIPNITHVNSLPQILYKIVIPPAAAAAETPIAAIQACVETTPPVSLSRKTNAPPKTYNTPQPIRCAHGNRGITQIGLPKLSLASVGAVFVVII